MCLGGFCTTTQHRPGVYATAWLAIWEPLEMGAWAGVSFARGRADGLAQRRRRSSAWCPPTTGACAVVVGEVFESVVVH